MLTSVISCLVTGGQCRDLSNKQGLESFPYDAGKRTGLQILHQIIAIRSCEKDERQIFVCMVIYL